MKKLFIFLKMILLSQFRQEFSTILGSVKKNFGINVPFWLGWLIYIVSQYSLIFLLFISLNLINQSNVRWIIIIGILLFNLVLPFTMARYNVVRILKDPLQYLLFQSPIHKTKILFTWLLAETVMFWIREFSLQIFAIYSIILMFDRWLFSIPLIIFWFILISYFYMSTLHKKISKEWFVVNKTTNLKEVIYLFRVAIMGIIMGIILKLLLTPLIKKSLSSEHLFNNVNESMRYFMFQLYNSLIVFIDDCRSLICNNIVFFTSVFAAITLIVLLCTLLKVKQQETSVDRVQENIDTTSNPFFQIYFWIARILFRNDFWVRRDLLLIQRLRVYTQMPLITQYIIPPSIVSLVGMYIVFIYNLHSENYIIAIWFLNVILISQITWLLLYAQPILNPSSELRQINLIKLTPYYKYGHFVQSKIKLTQVIIFPYHILMCIFYTLGSLFMKINIWDYLIGMSGCWMIFIAMTILSTYWVVFTARYDFKHILSVDINNIETRLIKTLLSLPKKLMVVGLLIPFFLVVFTDFSQVHKLMTSVFYVLLFITCVTLFLYYKLKNINLR
ncbi:hypothetical protein [Bacillus sp. MSP13]|uniref:hypothetical protein n=1 Tax=Bacillus sp. MSP13 TaxID=1071061 RepID=UPI00057BE9EE|nr:hypothetical protein [Bacillus sp. MSP13]